MTTLTPEFKEQTENYLKNFGDDDLKTIIKYRSSAVEEYNKLSEAQNSEKPRSIEIAELVAGKAQEILMARNDERLAYKPR